MNATKDELILHEEAVLKMFVDHTPSDIFICPTIAHKYRCFVGDASAEGLGGATELPDGMLILLMDDLTFWWYGIRPITS